MKKMARAQILLAAAVLLAAGQSAWGDFIQNPVDGGLALFDDTAGFTLADDFSLTTSANLETVTWWGGYAGNALPLSSDFTITIYSDSGGTPGAVVGTYSPVGVTRTLTAMTGDDLTTTPESIYEFTYLLPSALSLTGNVTYYLSVVDNTSAISSWLAGSGNGTSFAGDPNANLWAGQSRDFAYELITAVPEPVSMVMLGGLGMGMLAAKRIRARRR